MINPWEEKFQGRNMIKQLQSLSGEISHVYYMANDLFAQAGRLSRLLDNIYLEANKDKDSFFLGGFIEGRENEEQEQYQKDYDTVAEFLKDSHLRNYVNKDMFLQFCSDIYDQKEVEYVDKDNVKGLGITDKQVRRFLAHKSRAKKGSINYMGLRALPPLFWKPRGLYVPFARSVWVGNITLKGPKDGSAKNAVHN